MSVVVELEMVVKGESDVVTLCKRFPAVDVEPLLIPHLFTTEVGGVDFTNSRMKWRPDRNEMLLRASRGEAVDRQFVDGLLAVGGWKLLVEVEAGNPNCNEAAT